MLARTLTLIVALLMAAPVLAQPQAVPGNLTVAIVSTGYGAADTSIVLTTGHGARFTGTPPYNCAYFNATDYPGGINSTGTIDPNYEVVTVTARSTDTFTVTRGQEGTSASTKNTAGKTYVMQCGITAKRFEDIQAGTLTALNVDAGALAYNASTDLLSITPSGAYPGSDPLALSIERTLTGPPNTPPGAVNPLLGVSGTFAQSGAVNQGRIGIASLVSDHSSVVNRTISGAANNGSNLIRITTSTAHGWATGDRINIYGVLGTTEANGVWTITFITTTTFDLQGSTFTNTYTSGGTATNRGLMYAGHFNVAPALDRGGLVGTGSNGDDVVPIAVVNSGPGKATDMIWITDGVASGPASHTLIASDSNADYFLNFYGRAYTAGIDLSGATPDTASVPMIRIGDGHLLQAGTTAPSYLMSKTVNTDADAAVSALDLGSTFTKNDTNTRSFSVARIRPTLNFGGSNTTTTVNVLNVDTTNTATTGATVNPLRLGFGGLDRFVIDSNGAVSQTGADGGSTVYQFWTHANTLSVNTALTNFIARKSAGTAASPIRTQGADIVLRISAGGYEDSDDVAPATMVSPHRAALDFITTANPWSSSNHGMYLRVRTTAAGGTTTNAKGFWSEQGIELSTGSTATTARATTNGTNTLRLFNGTTPAGTLTNGVDVYAKSGNLYAMNASGTETQLTGGAAGSGDVVGPASATDNAVARYDTTTGKLLQNSGVTIDDNGGLAVPGTWTLSGDDAPAQIAANTNDYAISSTSAVTVVDADQIRAITGMTGGADGRQHTLINDGASDSVLILRAQDTGSTAANRFAMPQDVVLEPSHAATFWYDSTASRWRLLSSTAEDHAQRRYLPFDETDWLGNTGADTLEAHLPWNLALINTGSAQAKVAGNGVQRGILRCTSGTAANSGCQATTDLTAFRLSGGEFAEFVVNIDNTTNTTIRLGFLDTTTSTDATDGAYIEIPASTSPTCKTANNSTRTTSSAITTISTATWYRFLIEVDNTAANVTCTIFDANGNSLGSQTNSANIPTGSGRETGHGWVATNSGTSATQAIQVDYQAVGTHRAIVR